MPQPPQLLASVAVFTSQPFELGPEQCARSIGQGAKPHVPPEHRGEAVGDEGHTRPHEPQLRASVIRSTQPPEQNVVPVLRHAETHIMLPHVVAAAAVQACEQSPQCAGLVARFTSHPFDAIRSQSANPVVHAPIEHTPPWQRPVPLATRHRASHAPQLPRLLLKSVSQPLAKSPSQSPNPTSHVRTHPPLVHTALWCEPLVHARSHVPQWLALERRSTSHPFDASPSQSACVASQRVTQVPSTHEAVPPALLHALPHRPQFSSDVLSVAHAAPHAVSPE
jgi:hypothetical protein